MNEKFRVSENDMGSILGEEEIEAVAETIRKGEGLSASGENIIKFEEEFAAYCGAKHAVALSSATAALHIAAQILRIGKDDEVVATPQTFLSTLLAVNARGAKIRFADIDPDTLNIDPRTIEDKITPKTRAIFLVHLGGNPADMDPIMALGKKHNVPVVEDAAHAPGALYKGRKIGSIGDMTCFSFHSLKNMTSGGEGGMLTTDNDEFAEQARSLRTMGILGPLKEKERKYIGPYPAPEPLLTDHSAGAYVEEYAGIEEWGTHSRMSDMLAAIGRVQLRKLDDLNRKRTDIAGRYSEAVSRMKGVKLWKITPDSECVYHLYVVLIDRNVIKASQVEVIRYLEDVKKIQIVLRYWPVHLSKYMQFLGHKYGECPVCERVFFEEQLNLPICAGMPDEEVDYVIESLKETAEHFSR